METVHPNPLQGLISLHALCSSVLFAIIGIALLLLAYWIVEKLTPENTWREITQNKNMALAIVMAALIIGLSIIIASAIQG